MANHLSAIKSIRKNKTKRLRNRYQHKSTRTAIKKFQLALHKKEEEGISLHYSKVCSMIDKLVKKNIIHANKAARLKSKLYKSSHHLHQKKVENKEKSDI